MPRALARGTFPVVSSISALRGERGQTSAEYVGMLLVVVAIMAAISYADIGAAITAKVDQAICAIATDAGSEDCGGETPSTASRGAPARAAPNLYAAEMAPVALRSLDGSDAVPGAPVAQAAPEKGALRKAFDFLDEVSGAKEQRRLAGALLAGDFSDFEDAARDPLAYLRAGRSIPFVSKGPLVDELSGLNDARQAIVSAADGDYGPALLAAAFAVPIAGKFLKGGKYAGQALAWLGRSGPGRALVARGRGALRRVLREERGSVGGSGRNFPRPPAKDPKLDRVMDQLFRAEDRYPGGTAEAIRRGQGHIIKGKERVRQLEKIVKGRPLGDADRATAERVRNDLIDALKSQGEWPP